MAKISFITSDDRFYNVSRALSLMKTDIVSTISGAENVVIKVNCYCSNYQLSATHLDAVDALLDFISPHVKSQITLAESCADGSSLEAFHNYKYFDIQEKYDLALVDLQKDQYQTISSGKDSVNKRKISMPKTLIDSDFIISVTPPKTHGTYNYFGAISNLLPSHLDPTTQNHKSFTRSLLINKKSSTNPASISQHQELLNALYHKMPASLSIVDGYTSMQGNGPGSEGEIAATHWAVASTEAPLADLLSIYLLGFTLENIPYISEILNGVSLDNSIIVGDEWRKYINNIKKHPNFTNI